MVLAVMTVYTRALLGPKGFVSSGNTYGHVGPNMVTVAAWFGQWYQYTQGLKWALVLY